MRGRGDQIVARVLQIVRGRGQFGRAMVVDVAEADHACSTVVPAAITPRRIDPLADEIGTRCTKRVRFSVVSGSVRMWRSR